MLNDKLGGSARIPPDLGIVVQDDVQQGIMDLEFSVVFDKTQFAEFVHEKAYARSRRADHIGYLLLDLEVPTYRLWLALLSSKILEEEGAVGRGAFRSN